MTQPLISLFEIPKDTSPEHTCENTPINDTRYYDRPRKIGYLLLFESGVFQFILFRKNPPLIYIFPFSFLNISLIKQWLVQHIIY